MTTLEFVNDPTLIVLEQSGLELVNSSTLIVIQDSGIELVSDSTLLVFEGTGEVIEVAGQTVEIHEVGMQGAAGAPGVDGIGNEWRDGSGAPSNALGADGDYYLDNDTGDVYNKAAGVYSVTANIKGVDGAAGAALDARNLVITDIMISPLVVSTVLVGGGAVWGWFIAVGANALSLATTDAAGTTALGTMSPRITPLPLYDQIAAAAAVGTVCTRTGDSSISLQTPLVVPNGTFVVVGIRTKHVAAAITSGVLDGQIGISGFWD